MTIIQPRLENISTFECSVEELLDWAETYVRPRAKLAFEGKGEQVPGDWCRFCRARTSCKACADEAMALVKEEFLDLDADVLEDETEETDATASFDRTLPCRPLNPRHCFPRQTLRRCCRP